MATPLQVLLSLNPVEALVKMFNDANGTDYLIDRFTASAPAVVAGTTTQVTLTGFLPANSFDDYTFQGSYTITYERLEMASFLQGILVNYHPVLPLSTQNILDEITSLIGQQFYIDDVVLEEVTRDNGALYRLKAKPESLRFVGYIDLPLITLTPIASILTASALSGAVDESAVVYSPNASLPFLNATDWRDIAGSFAVGDLAQDKINLVTLFNNVVPDPSSDDDFTLRPWYVDSTTPGAFNLYNASVVGYTDGTGVNSAIPALESALVVSLDGSYCTNFADGSLTIPYTAQDFNQDGFTDQPRLIADSVVSLSDGSAWNVYLNGFVAGEVIQSFQQTPLITMDRALDRGTLGWRAYAGLPQPTNLYGATVVYNGQVRPIDLPAATQGLDRVLIVDMSTDNSKIEGEYKFYYSSPISLTIPLLKSTVGSAFYFDLTPTAGVSPFTYAASGTLPDGITLTDHELTGTPTTAGSYLYDVTITDANGVAVVFNVTHEISAVVGILAIDGTLPGGVVGQAYSALLDIEGGIAPYLNPRFINGVIPPDFAIEVIHNTLHVYGDWPAPDTYPMTVGVDSTDGQTATASFEVVASSSFAPLTVSGTFNNAVQGFDYSSSLTIAGGSGVYNVPTVTNGSVPDGLTLSISTVGTPKVVLSGTPTVSGIYEWTSVLTDDHGDSTTFVSTITLTPITRSTLDTANMYTYPGTIKYGQPNSGVVSADGLTLIVSGGNNYAGVVVGADAAKTTGNWYFEVTHGPSDGTNGSGHMVALVSKTWWLENLSRNGASHYGVDIQNYPNCCFWEVYNSYLNGDAHFNGNYPRSPNWQGTGAVLGIAINVDTGAIWLRNSSAGWWDGALNAVGTGDPASGLNPWGVLNATSLAGGLMPGMNNSYTGASMTLNFGQNPFTYPVPEGFFGGWIDG